MSEGESRLQGRMAAVAGMEQHQLPHLGAAWLPAVVQDPLSSALLGAAALLLALYWLLGRSRSLQGLPPGPKPWPLVGNFAYAFFPQRLGRKRVMEMTHRGPPGNVPRLSNRIADSPHLLLTSLVRAYGSIYCFFVGSLPVIVLNDFEAVRDALVNQAEVFSDRPTVPLVTIFTKKKDDNSGHTQKPSFLQCLYRYTALDMYRLDIEMSRRPSSVQCSHYRTFCLGQKCPDFRRIWTLDVQIRNNLHVWYTISC